MKLVFAILAHRDPAVVEWLAGNLTSTCPNADVVVFDSSADGSVEPNEVERLAVSRPLRYARIAPFHYLTMTELAQRDYDALVAVDWDVAMLRRGFEGQLSEILETFAYAAPRFLPVDECEGSDQGRQVWFWWDRYWRDLLGARQPYDVFNACQIFRRDLVDRFVADPEMPRILEAVDRARVIGMEEFVYPTRTVSYGFPATSLPGGYAIVTHLHDYDELELLSCDRSVHLVHKIATSDQRSSVDYLLEHQGDAAAAARRIALRPFLSGRRRVQIRTDLTRARTHLDVLRKGP